MRMAWSPYPNSIMNLDFEINNRLRYSHDPDLRLSELSTREDSPRAILRYEACLVAAFRSSVHFRHVLLPCP